MTGVWGGLDTRRPRDHTSAKGCCSGDPGAGLPELLPRPDQQPDALCWLPAGGRRQLLGEPTQGPHKGEGQVWAWPGRWQPQPQHPYGCQECERAHCSAGDGGGKPSKSPPHLLGLGCRGVTLPSRSVGRRGWTLGLQRAVWPLVPGRHHQLGLRLCPAFLPRGLCQGDRSPGLDCTESQDVTPCPLGLAGGAQED